MNGNEEKDPFASIKDNWRFLVLIFFIGGAYFKFGAMADDIIVLEQRLQKKIQIINDLHDELDDLQDAFIVHEAIKDCKK